MLPRIIGIIGMGRLGSQIAKKLMSQHNVIITDKSFAKAYQHNAKLGIPYSPIEELVKHSDVTILAIPPDEVAPLLKAMEREFKCNSTIINMATSVDTSELSGCISRNDIKVVGMKPVTQAHGISLGLPTVFISSYGDQDVIRDLAELLKPIGTVRQGDETAVRDINAIATDYALRLCIGLLRELEQAGVHDEKVTEAALKTVAAGTILDYPPKLPNYYIEQRLKILFGGGVNERIA